MADALLKCIAAGRLGNAKRCACTIKIMVGRLFVAVLLALERAFEDDEDRYIFIQCITSRHISCPKNA